MSELNFYTGYHATAIENVELILTQGFEFKRNKEHWLGNGVYFFTDLALAYWWKSNPTIKFGSFSQNKVILKALMKVGRDDVCDLRELKDYIFCYDQYNLFAKELEELGEPIQTRKLSVEELRCIFFDWLAERFCLKLCVGCFYKKTPKYLKHDTDRCKTLMPDLKIPYNEIQMCVFDNSIIEDVYLYNYEESEEYAPIYTEHS